jgi:hypothetical protein
MKTIIAVALLALVGLPISAVALSPSPCANCRSVPGPIMGAGLPIIAAGYGLYWLVRRRHRT